MNQDCSIYLAKHRMTKFSNILALAKSVLTHFLTNANQLENIP